MNTKIYLASAIAAVIAAPAFAGSLAEPVVEAPVEAPVEVVAVDAAPEVTWDGFYAGVSATRADATWTTGGADAEGEDLLMGIHAGYNHDLGDFVVGAEAGFSTENPTDRDETTMTAKAKVGYDLGKVLPYATAGYSMVDAGVNEADGWVYGVGAEYLVSDKIGLGAEYLRGEYDVEGGADEYERSDIAVRANFHF